MSIFKRIFDFFIHGFNKMTEWIHSIWVTAAAIHTSVLIGRLHLRYPIKPMFMPGTDGANCFIKNSTNP